METRNIQRENKLKWKCLPTLLALSYQNLSTEMRWQLITNSWMIIIDNILANIAYLIILFNIIAHRYNKNVDIQFSAYDSFLE